MNEISTSKVDAWAKELGLELLDASPVERSAYANVPPLRCEEVRRYDLPRKSFGARNAHSLIVTLYIDGSFGAFIEAARGNEMELRRMVEAMETRPHPAHQIA